MTSHFCKKVEVQDNQYNFLSSLGKKYSPTGRTFPGQRKEIYPKMSKIDKGLLSVDFTVLLQ